MELQMEHLSGLSLEMATDEEYRELSKTYRSSKEYSKMIGLYPILQTSIKDCQDEKLVA